MAERLRSQGSRSRWGTGPRTSPACEVVTYSPAVATDNVELVAARRVRGAGGAPVGDPGRHLRHPTVPGRVGDARQDHDRLDALADPRRGGPAPLLPHRSGRQRDRHQCRLGQRASGSSWRPTRATARSRRCARTWPCSPTSSRTIWTTTAPLSVLRDAFSDFVGERDDRCGRVRRRRRRRGDRTCPRGDPGGPGAGSDYVMEELELLRSSVSFRLRGPGGRPRHAAHRRPGPAQRPQRRGGGGGRAAGRAHPSRRRRRRWPASPG